jgi:hypothetical protein
MGVKQPRGYNRGDVVEIVRDLEGAYIDPDCPRIAKGEFQRIEFEVLHVEKGSVCVYDPATNKPFYVHDERLIRRKSVIDRLAEVTDE